MPNGVIVETDDAALVRLLVLGGAPSAASQTPTTEASPVAASRVGPVARSVVVTATGPASGGSVVDEASTRQRVLSHFRAHPSTSFTATDLATAIGTTELSIRWVLARAFKAGEIVRLNRGVYRLAPSDTEDL